jgi:DUF4097 and DUF4098 domain-containing protein YvlB
MNKPHALCDRRIDMKKIMTGALPALLFLLAGFTGLYGLGDLPLVNTETISLEGAADLSIRYDDAEVIIRESESDELVIREYMSRDRPRYYAKISRSAGTVRVKQGGQSWLFWLVKIRAEIYLPPSFRGNLQIANSSGSVSAETDLLGYRTIDISVNSGSVGLSRLSGETVSIRVSSGELNIAGLGGSSFVSVSSGKLYIGELAGTRHQIKSSSGRTRIGVREGEANIEVTSGNIALDQVRGRMALKISSGSVGIEEFSGEGGFELSSGNLNLGIRELTGDLRVRLSSGSAELSLPGDLPFHLDAVTDSGSVQVRDTGGGEPLRVSGNSTVLRPFGPLAESAGARTIYARTNSGQITITRR